MQASCRRWALEEFGKAALGDARRTARLVGMAARAAERPAGTITSVFAKPSERQGAYDFIENDRVSAQAILESAVDAASRRASAFPFVYVPLDGTSLNLADLARSKGFGSIGARDRRGTGLKVLDAIMLSPDGVPLGVAGLKWWARGARAICRRKRTLEQKETSHWLDVSKSVMASLERNAPKTRAWFLVDREGDAAGLLTLLATSSHLFTVRSQATRRVSLSGFVDKSNLRNRRERRTYLRPYMRRRPVLVHDLLELPARGDQPARVACVAVTTARVVLNLHTNGSSYHHACPVNVVWVREYGQGHRSMRGRQKTPQKTIDWLLFTNHPVDTTKDARAVIRSYEHRWLIEEQHHGWKSGLCNVERSQLRSVEHVMKWATVLAAVTTRAARLKHLSRQNPQAPASTELSDAEIKTLILLKRDIKKTSEVIPDGMPDLETATQWIAQLGGYTGRESGGPPGQTTIGRGLALLQVATGAIEAFKRDERSD